MDSGGLVLDPSNEAAKQKLTLTIDEWSWERARRVVVMVVEGGKKLFSVVDGERVKCIGMTAGASNFPPDGPAVLVYNKLAPSSCRIVSVNFSSRNVVVFFLLQLLLGSCLHPPLF